MKEFRNCLSKVKRQQRFIENDRPIYTEEVFQDIANFIKKNDLLRIKKEGKKNGK